MKITITFNKEEVKGLLSELFLEALGELAKQNFKGVRVSDLLPEDTDTEEVIYEGLNFAPSTDTVTIFYNRGKFVLVYNSFDDDFEFTLKSDNVSSLEYEFIDYFFKIYKA